MDQLGPSLKSMHEDAGNMERHALRVVSEQLLDRLESMHNRHWLHLDVKPANFLLPRSEDIHEPPTLHAIDFGLSRKWWDAETGRLVPSIPRRGAVGTVRFASIANQQYEQLGRRDDLEALAYTVLTLHRGELPWGRVQAPTKQERFRLMLEHKRGIGEDELCDGLPSLASFLRAARGLRPDEKPDYEALRALLRAL